MATAPRSRQFILHRQIVVGSARNRGAFPRKNEGSSDNTVATLSTLIEPIMIVVMGAIAGGVIFALYLPIFSLGHAVKGGVR
jgi:hypothetical protein